MHQLLRTSALLSSAQGGVHSDGYRHVRRFRGYADILRTRADVVLVRFWGKADKLKHLGSLALSANDAVDGAHSAASRCHRVVASKRTTLRGAVHGRG